MSSWPPPFLKACNYFWRVRNHEFYPNPSLLFKICLNYQKLIQIILNLTKIEAFPKCIRNKSSEIQYLFSAKIPSLMQIHTRLLLKHITETTDISYLSVWLFLEGPCLIDFLPSLLSISWWSNWSSERCAGIVI